MTLTNVIQVACGKVHSVALLSDGTVQCWGYNGDNVCDPVHLTFTNVMMPYDDNVVGILW
jgi:alpha-tubulin suppressor-like RCC1 family protein